MNHRYIPRFRLQERQYTAGSPLVIAAGALLLDTQAPRLVAQLKFKSVSPKTIAALRVELCCFGSAGAITATRQFVYQSLHVRRGQAFGQYTAIALPADAGSSFTAAVRSVTFADGSSWVADAEAIWSTLPGFLPLEAALHEPELLRLCRSKLPWAQYAYAAPADLWYCACGGVNHAGEGLCHRCRHPRAFSERYADMASLAALRQAGLEQAAAAAAQAKAEAEAAAQARQAAKAKAEAVAASASGLASAATERLRHAAIHKNRLLQIGAAVAAVIAAVILLPKIGGMIPTAPPPAAQIGSEVSSPARSSPAASAPAEAPQPAEINVTTASDGETFALDIREDEDGNITVTREMMLEYFPQLRYFQFNSGPRMGNEIDAYLANTYHMSRLVGSNGIEGADDQYGRSFMGNTRSIRCLLVFSDATTLCGYFIGVPEKVEEGLWRLQIKRCDYAFSALYEKQAQAFRQAEAPAFIPPEEIESCGATWFLSAFNFGRDHQEDKNAQLYYLWNQFHSAYLEQFSRRMSEFDERRPTGPTGGYDIERWCYYFLLDESYGLIGYSKLSSADPHAPALQPTLPAPTNLRWEYDEYSPNEVALAWDWMPPAGEAAEDYHYRIEYTTDGSQWTTGAWHAQQTSDRPVHVVLLSDRQFSSGEYKFRVTAWKGPDNNHIEAISSPAEMIVPLYVTVDSAPFIPSAIEFETRADKNQVITMSSDHLSAGSIYFLFIRANDGNMTIAGSRQANPTTAAAGKIEYPFGNSAFPFAEGFSVQLWEIRSQTIEHGMPQISISARPAPMPVTAQPGGAGAMLATPTNFKFQYEHRVHAVWNPVTGAQGYELRVEKNGEQYDTYRYEDSGKAMNIVARLFHDVARESSPNSRAAVFTFRVRALAPDPSYHSPWSAALTINVADIIPPLKLHTVTKETDTNGNYLAFTLDGGAAFPGGYWYLATFPLDEPNSFYTISVNIPSQREIFTARNTTGTLDEQRMSGTVLLQQIDATLQTDREMTVVITGTQDEPVKIQ